MSMDTRSISPEVFTNATPEGLHIILTSPPTMAQHLPRAHRGNTLLVHGAPHSIAQLIQYLNEAHPGGVGFIRDTNELKLPTPLVVSLLEQGSLIDDSKCVSVAYRNTQVWQNLMPYPTLNEAHARLPAPHRPVETAIGDVSLIN
jgi:hypothetical protein